MEMHSLQVMMKKMQERFLAYESAPLNMTLHAGDKMLCDRSQADIAHYVDVGRSAIEITMHAMFVCAGTNFTSVLEFPSGHGRVTRHLVNFFPEAHLAVSDLYPEMLEFCAEQFNATPILSQEDFTTLDFGQKFDLIWCGSLLTHLPEQLVRDCFECIVRHLVEPTDPGTSGGVAIITLVGHVSKSPNDVLFYATAEQWQKEREAYFETGFSFFPYADGSKDWGGVGNTLTRPAYIMKLCEQYENIRIRHFAERQWDKHQDVLVIEKYA